MRIPLNMRHAKAALIVAAKGDFRYYLNAILVEAGDDVRVVAADGHRMVVIRAARAEAGAATTVIVPREAIEAALRLKYDRKQPERIAFLERRADDDWSIRVGHMSIGFRPLEGHYPNYRGVVPKTCSGKVSNFNGRYVGDMYRIAEILSGKGYPFFEVLQNGMDAPALVLFAGDAIGVLMPLRTIESSEPAVAPEWVLQAPTDAGVKKAPKVAAG